MTDISTGTDTTIKEDYFKKLKNLDSAANGVYRAKMVDDIGWPGKRKISIINFFVFF